MRTRVMDESQRGQGFTTMQMRNAPIGALYVWPVAGSINYAVDLARGIGRDDLKIVPASILDRSAERLRGTRWPAIILDHACEPNDEDYFLLRELRGSIIVREQPAKA